MITEIFCDECGEQEAMHSVHFEGKRTDYCCRCYVRAGNPPAEWHSECMDEFNKQLETA